MVFGNEAMNHSVSQDSNIVEVQRTEIFAANEKRQNTIGGLVFLDETKISEQKTLKRKIY